MKILILGSQGNLGSQLIKIFEKEGKNEVTGYDRNDIDITKKNEIIEKISELKPEVIINAVAYNAVDKAEESETEFEMAKKLNIEAVHNLALIAKKLDAIFVQYSSDYVFAGDNPSGYNEKAKTEPINKYGFTKAEGEKELARVAISGLRWYLIRTSKLFGPKGESEMSKPSFFDIMLKISTEKNELEVIDEEKSCFTYTPDLALATKNLIESKLNYGIYHITNSEPATWYEACLELFKIAEKNIKVNPISADKMPRPAKRPKFSQLLNTKTVNLRSYKEALKSMINDKLKIH